MYTRVGKGTCSTPARQGVRLAARFQDHTEGLKIAFGSSTGVCLIRERVFGKKRCQQQLGSTRAPAHCV